MRLDYKQDFYQPKWSIGRCVNADKCKQLAVDLADGWCVDCYDVKCSQNVAKLADPPSKARKRAFEKATKKAKSHLIMRKRTQTNKGGRHMKDCNCPQHRSYKGDD